MDELQYQTRSTNYTVSFSQVTDVNR